MTETPLPDSATNDKIDELIRSNAKVSDAALVGLERERVSRRRFRWTLAGFAVLLGGVYLQLHSAADSRSQFRDCVVPTGACYQQGQQRTREIVRQLEQGVIVANCVPLYLHLPKPQQEARVQGCVAVIQVYLRQATQ